MIKPCRPVNLGEDAGPTDEELVEIEAIERPLIEAELDELDELIRIISVRHHPTEIDLRRYRRAQARVVREMRRFLDTMTAPAKAA